jgi:hypothetical protein
MYLIETAIITPACRALDVAIVHRRILGFSQAKAAELRRLRRAVEASIDHANFVHDEVIGPSYRSDLTAADRQLWFRAIRAYRKSNLYTSSETHNALLYAESVVGTSLATDAIR